MKKLIFLLTVPLFFSCTSRAGIPPISNKPIPRAKAPLQVWSVIPGWVRYSYQEYVTIDGLGFEEGAEAFIGGFPCAETIFKSYSNIKCYLPRIEEDGKYSVTVRNPDGVVAPLEIPVEERVPYDADDDYYYGEEIPPPSDGLVYLHIKV